MIIVMNAGILPDGPEVHAVMEKGVQYKLIPAVKSTSGTRSQVTEVYLKDGKQLSAAVPEHVFTTMEGVSHVMRVTPPQISLRTNGKHEPKRIVLGCDEVGYDTIGQGLPALMVGGMCAVDREVERTVALLEEQGVAHIRGGWRKPRSTSLSFRGFGEKGLKWLLRAAKNQGMRSVWCEVIESIDVDIALQTRRATDFKGDLVLWVGARNTGNYRLLEKLGQTREVVAMIKNGVSMRSIDELFDRAGFVVNGTMVWDDEGMLDQKRSAENGNERLLFCVRGIQNLTDSHSTLRFQPNYDWITLIHKQSWVPAVFDPSHISGSAKRVPEVLESGLKRHPAAVMIEVHHRPEIALCDQEQAVPPGMLTSVIDMIKKHNDELLEHK